MGLQTRMFLLVAVLFGILFGRICQESISELKVAGELSLFSL